MAAASCASAQENNALESFDSSFLQGQARGMDLSRFANGSPVMAGNYLADLYVNGTWQGRDQFAFRVVESEEQARTCFTLEQLLGFGVDTDSLGLNGVADDECRLLGDWIPGAFERFDVGALRLDLNIPQANMRRTARGYVDPRFWDAGISAARLSYNFNAFHNRLRRDQYRDGQRVGEEWSSSDIALLSLNGGFNVGAWQFRHDASFQWRDGDSNWQSIATYARRPLPDWRSELLLGDAFTEGNLFDSVGFRGLSVGTDDRMLPDSLRGYAPAIRGVAETEARVEVRQRGQLIYQSSVPAGPFLIDDLYPTGYGGDLDVTVIETDGREQRFSVPFASVPRMLRPGHQRYNLTVGEVREVDLNDSPWLGQWTYERGLTNRLTGYTGVTWSDGYISVLGGGAVGTPLGAFSFDTTQARTDFDNHDTRRGQSFRLGYSKLLQETGTNFTLAAYRYSTSGFLGLREAVRARDYDARGLDVDALRRRRSELQMTVNQRLPQGYGALYLTGSWRDYWDDEGSSQNYQIGYNNRYGRLNYGISALRTRNEAGESDTQYALSVSLPVSSGAGAASLTGSVNYRGSDYDSSRIGLAGSVGDEHRFSYNVSVADGAHRPTSGSVGGQYRTDAAMLRASQSVSRDARQTSIGASGTVVAHGGGVTFSPQRGETLVLVEAADAAGARVASSAGVTVDRRGYAVVPFVTPYRQNAVSLDPNGMSAEVELRNSRQLITPYAGAIGHVVFETVSGRALLIRTQGLDGRPLPFGAQVYDEDDQPVAIVAQGGRIYLRTDETRGRLRVEEGNGRDDCILTYEVADEAASDSGYIYLEAHCER